MGNSSISVGGNLSGVANIGDNATISNQSIENPDRFEFLDEIFKSLQDIHPDAAPSEKLIVAKLEVKKLIKQEPLLKDRLLNALKSGAVELVKVITDNPFVSVSVETFRGWLETGG